MDPKNDEGSFAEKVVLEKSSIAVKLQHTQTRLNEYLNYESVKRIVCQIQVIAKNKLMLKKWLLRLRFAFYQF